MDTPGLQNRQSLVNIRSVHWCVVVPITGQETIRALTILDELSLNMYFHSFHLYFSSRTRAKCCILSTKRGACNMSITYKFTVYIKVLLKWNKCLHCIRQIHMYIHKKYILAFRSSHLIVLQSIQQIHNQWYFFSFCFFTKHMPENQDKYTAIHLHLWLIFYYTCLLYNNLLSNSIYGIIISLSLSEWLRVWAIQKQ